MNRKNKQIVKYNWIVYITVNILNGHFYFGVHRTNININDGYIGCGIYRQAQAIENYPFHNAVKKYGYNNFKRTIIKIFPDTKDGKTKAFLFEKELVNETVLKSDNCYNIAIGGSGGINPSLYKKVYKFDLNGNYLRSFKNCKLAAEDLNVKNVISATKAIRNNCLGATNSAYNYYWSYTKKFNYKKSLTKKEIAQYDVNGNFIRKFNSISEAEYELHLTSIEQAVRKKWLCGNYQWRYYTNDENIEKYYSVFTKNKNIKINMFNKYWEFIKTYNSVEECAIENNLNKSQINRCLKQKIHSHKGFKFKYFNDKNI